MSSLNVGNITDGTNSVATEKLSKGTAAAWVNFDGTTNAIRGSYNVSSITDEGTGQYMINFSSGLSSQNISNATAVVKFLLELSPSSTWPITWKLTPAVTVEGIESTRILDGTCTVTLMSVKLP